MHSNTNLYEAHNQWANRPPDQRFASLDDLYKFTSERRHFSNERRSAMRDIKLVVTDLDDLAVNSSVPQSRLTHWSFGQLCSHTRTPASYLRGLPPSLARECLDHGLKKSCGKTKLLLLEDSDSGLQTLGAVTGPEYGRIWDSQVVSGLMEAIQGTGWRVPHAITAFGSEASGLYASDRDMFAFMVHDEKPLEIGDAKLGRGFFLWNSETGAATFGLTTFLYNYVCGNHIVWGADQIEELRIVHRKWAPEKFGDVALPMLNRFVESRAASTSIVSAISKAMETKVGRTLEDVQKRFSAERFTQREIARAWSVGKAEGENVTTLWGMLQGFTAGARQYAHVDARVRLESRAGQLLKKLV